MRISIIFLGCYLFVLSLSAQKSWTPYDDLPCIPPNIKPQYEESMADWAKMLYEYPINYQKLIAAKSKVASVKSPIERYFKIWQRCVLSYVDDEGNIHLPAIGDLNNELLSIQYSSKNVSQKMTDKWTFVGPKETFWLNEQGSSTPPKACPWQVNVYSFDVSPTNTNVIYAGSETGFMNKSFDNGQSWELIGKDYYFGGGITAVAIHPENDNVVFVAGGNQMHKTIDGGATWNPLLSQERFYADRLRIDKNNPDRIIAASSRGIYLSIDGGISWRRSYNTRTWDVRFHPENSDMVYGISTNGSQFRCVISLDGGENFSLVSSFPNNIVQSDGAMLATTDADPNTIMAVLLSQNNTPYLLKGDWTNNQLSWENVATGRTSQLRMNNGQGYFDLVLDISPVNPDIVYVGTTTLYKSINGGKNFTAVGGYEGNFEIHPDIQDIKILENGDIWVATDGGMNYSTDNFVSQNNYRASVKGLMGSNFWGFDQGWNEDITVGGRYHNGNTSIADFYGEKALRMGGAESPTGWVVKGKSRHVAFDDLGNGWILPTTAEGRPEGRFIFSKHPNMDEYGGRRSNVVQHPEYFGTLYLGEGDGLWRSEDSGVNWELLYQFSDRVRYLLNSPSDGNVIYVDVVNRGLFKSEDGGLTFVHKPNVTAANLGGSFWAGKLHFDISPTDANTLYICQQNGTWSADKGRVLVSNDGGNSVVDWTSNIDDYLKSILVQKGENGEDIVYLFTIAKNNLSSKVYYRTAKMDQWERMDSEYPAGMVVNIPKIFYRDSKIRVSGNAGVWEHPLLSSEYEPIVRPWVEKKTYPCILDTVLFNDFSIVDHKDVSWKWNIIPEPVWSDNLNTRNPKVVLGNVGTYDVELVLTKNGKTYSKKIDKMVETLSCPSIEDCSNPDYLPKNQWKLVEATSQEVNYPGLATMCFDDDPNTIWHTRWSTGNDPYPHEIIIDLGSVYEIFSFEYLTRQVGVNGRIKDYELYFSEEQNEWADPIKIGSFINTSAPQKVSLETSVRAKYMKFKALSEVNGGPWASAAEFSLVGCKPQIVNTEILSLEKHPNAFPIPSTGLFYIDLPKEDYKDIRVFNSQGHCVKEQNINPSNEHFNIDLFNQPSGIYFVKFTTIDNRTYHIKLVKTD